MNRTRKLQICNLLKQDYPSIFAELHRKTMETEVNIRELLGEVKNDK